MKIVPEEPAQVAGDGKYPDEPLRAPLFMLRAPPSFAEGTRTPRYPASIIVDRRKGILPSGLVALLKPLN